jgi:hypothetical protein
MPTNEIVRRGSFKVRTDLGILKRWEYYVYRIREGGLTEIRWLPHGKASTYHTWKVGQIPSGAEILD